MVKPAATARTVAEKYLSLGWRVVPIAPKSKSPGSGWDKLRLEPDQIEENFGPDSNIGVILGEPSGWLVDVDYDNPLARRIAGTFLPPGAAIFGRQSAPRSHFLYVVNGAKSEQFADPAPRDASGEKRKMLVEIRSTGLQTVFPGSVHPSGEPIEWVKFSGKPAQVISADTLRQCVAKEAAAALLALYRGKGTFYETALYIAGGLCKAGWTYDDAEKFIRAVAVASEQDDIPNTLRVLDDTYKKHPKGKPLAGWGKLAEFIPPVVVAKVQNWLGISTLVEDYARDHDLGNARRLLEYYGNRLHWVDARNKFFYHDGFKYVPMTVHEARPLFTPVVEGIYEELSGMPDQETAGRLLKWIYKSKDYRAIDRALRLGSSMMQKSQLDFDQDEYLVNFQNGVYDAQHKIMLPHAATQMLTAISPYNFNPELTDADCPRWTAHVNSLFCGDTDLVRCLRHGIGYSVLGTVREDRFFMLVGEGRNGKGTLLDIVTAVLGRDYCTEAAMTSFVLDRSGTYRMRSDLAIIADKRFVKVDEINEGVRLDEALVRKLTGGGRLVAARKYENECEYLWRGKLWFLVNHKPKIRDGTSAIWERMVLLETPAKTVTRTARDNRREEIPREEGEAIAAWLMRCVDDYVNEGLYFPDKVVEAMQEYREQSNVVVRFVQDACESRGETLAADLYVAFREWATLHGEPRVISQLEFEDQLEKLGYVKGEVNDTDVWKGIFVKGMGDF